jgi:hypothetical protein
MDNGKVPIGKRQIGDSAVVACVVFQTRDPKHLLQVLGEVLIGIGDSPISQSERDWVYAKRALHEAATPEEIMRRIANTKRSAPDINSTPKALHLINQYRSSEADHTRYRDATLYSSKHPAIFVE